MKTRTLGRTGLTVSEIGLGTLAIGGAFKIGDYEFGRGIVNDKDSLKMLEIALDTGVNFFDTADIYGYGKSEELLGKALLNKREKAIITTKVGNRGDNNKWIKDFSKDWVKEACEKSLKRINSDYIDLYLLHTPDTDFEFKDEIFEVFNTLKKEGKIRFFGCSVGTPQQGIDFINSGFGDVVEVAYNIGDKSAVNELFPLAEHKDVGLIIKSPLMSGLLTGKYNKNSLFEDDDFRKTIYTRERLNNIVNAVDYLLPLARETKLTYSQLALKYCLSRKEVSCVIPGGKSAGQILENTRASDAPDLPISILEQIEASIKEL